MNDELELIEEFQSDSIDELASERKKNKVIQRFTMQPSSSTKYYYIENYPNGGSIKSEISPENLDELGKKIKVHWLNKNIVAIHYFMQQYQSFFIMKEATLMINLIEEVKLIWV